ncbi:hypothetical protein ENBRE01_2434 [Enteropsectra breve]|nr:hypothetical protein ENBRE01_2434 [Enteropsectra breve]
MKKNLSIRQISTELKIPKSTVGDFIKKLKETGTGRQTILTTSEEEKISRFVTKNLKLCANDIKKQVDKMFKKDIARRTVGDILARNNIGCYIARKSHSYQIKIRFLVLTLLSILGFSDEKWKNIIFSDEASFELFDCKKQTRVYRKPSTAYESINLAPTVKFGGGKIMVWGAISYNGVGNLIFIENTLDSIKYIQLLSNNLEESADIIGLGSFIFQQDGASCHTSKLSKGYMEEMGIELLKWAAQSPDLNPFELIKVFTPDFGEFYFNKSPDMLRWIKIW